MLELLGFHILQSSDLLVVNFNNIFSLVQWLHLDHSPGEKVESFKHFCHPGTNPEKVSRTRSGKSLFWNMSQKDGLNRCPGIAL